MPKSNHSDSLSATASAEKPLDCISDARGQRRPRTTPAGAVPPAPGPGQTRGPRCARWRRKGRPPGRRQIAVPASRRPRRPWPRQFLRGRPGRRRSPAPHRSPGAPDRWVAAVVPVPFRGWFLGGAGRGVCRPMPGSVRMYRSGLQLAPDLAPGQRAPVPAATQPSRVTRRTRDSAARSASGSPATSSRSARAPGGGMHGASVSVARSPGGGRGRSAPGRWPHRSPCGRAGAAARRRPWRPRPRRR
jgi:hypothetical protein